MVGECSAEAALFKMAEDVWISLVEDLIRCQPWLYRYLDLFQIPLIKGACSQGAMSSLAMDLPEERLRVDEEQTS